NVEAHTVAGGIFLFNDQPLTIGGVNNTLTGATVDTSGDINIRSLGTLTLADTTAVTPIVDDGATSGNIFLTATGARSATTDAVPNAAARARGGSIPLAAGRDVLLGTSGANFDNDVEANNDVTVTAGRDVILTGDADLRSDDFNHSTGGSVSVTAGR